LCQHCGTQHSYQFDSFARDDESELGHPRPDSSLLGDGKILMQGPVNSQKNHTAKIKELSTLIDHASFLSNNEINLNVQKVYKRNLVI
jgi:hypothetical protein